MSSFHAQCSWPSGALCLLLERKATWMVVLHQNRITARAPMFPLCSAREVKRWDKTKAPWCRIWRWYIFYWFLYECCYLLWAFKGTGCSCCMQFSLGCPSGYSTHCWAHLMCTVVTPCSASTGPCSSVLSWWHLGRAVWPQGSSGMESDIKKEEDRCSVSAIDVLSWWQYRYHHPLKYSAGWFFFLQISFLLTLPLTCAGIWNPIWPLEGNSNSSP